MNSNKVFIIYFQILPSKDYISLRDITAGSVSEVPYKYTDYASIFSEKEASILASHQDHDHAIKLQPGSKPPLQPIYLLS